MIRYLVACTLLFSKLWNDSVTLILTLVLESTLDDLPGVRERV